MKLPKPSIRYGWAADFGLLWMVLGAAWYADPGASPVGRAVAVLTTCVGTTCWIVYFAWRRAHAIDLERAAVMRACHDAIDRETVRESDRQLRHEILNLLEARGGEIKFIKQRKPD